MSNKNTTPLMMLVNGRTRQQVPAMELIPIHRNCVFLQAIYDPSNKKLDIVHEKIYVRPQFLPKVDEFGRPVYLKPQEGEVLDPKITNGPLQERYMLNAFFDYQLENLDDIIAFISHHTAENPAVIKKQITTFQTWYDGEVKKQKKNEVAAKKALLDKTAGPQNEAAPLSVVKDEKAE